MSTTDVPFKVTVYMNKRDITDWCRRVTWGQPDRYLEKEFAITTHAWNLFQENARYDIYATYDPNSPRSECVIYQGYIIPSERQLVNVTKDQMPMVTITGKSFSSIAFRKAPKETIVMVPDPQEYHHNMNTARRLLRRYNKPVGRIKVYAYVISLKRAVFNLARAAGLQPSWSAPSYPIQPLIIEPGLTYWDAILQLIEPFAVEVYYEEGWNRIHFADPVSRYYGRRPLVLPGSLITSVRARPIHRNRVRRVLVRIPPWP